MDRGVDGYGGRDPKTETPRVPSVPETQDDAGMHGTVPKPEREPAASNEP